jgi:hypothetical protein
VGVDKLSICYVLVFFLILISSADAAIIGVSPSILHFNRMLKDGFAESNIVVTTSTEYPIWAKITTEGEIKDWITLGSDKTRFNFSSSNPFSTTVVMKPPKDAKSGNYSGIIKMTTEEQAAVTSGAGSSVIAQISLLIYVEIIGDEIISCRAGAISTNDAEIGQPFIVRTTVWNDGNVRLRPEILVNIYDQYKTRIVMTKTFFGEEILPTRSKELVKEIDNSLPLGQYFSDITIKDCQIFGSTTFDVLEKGAVADSGVLMGIKANDFGYSNEPMIIAPIFRNTGNRKVVAQFKGEIRNLKNNKIVMALESDKLEVVPSETAELRMFYTPGDIGDYQISGRVVYNNKITFDESSKIIKVIKGQGKKGISWIFFIMLYLVIGLLILILIGKIKKAKKKVY